MLQKSGETVGTFLDGTHVTRFRLAALVVQSLFGFSLLLGVMALGRWGAVRGGVLRGGCRRRRCRGVAPVFVFATFLLLVAKGIRRTWVPFSQLDEAV